MHSAQNVFTIFYTVLAQLLYQLVLKYCPTGLIHGAFPVLVPPWDSNRLGPISTTCATASPGAIIEGLVTNNGAGSYKTGVWGGGGHVTFHPYKKGGGAEISFSHAEGGGGHKTFWGSFYAVA